MKTEDWIEMHEKDSFEKLVNDVLPEELYWLKCDAYSYGQAMAMRNHDESKYYEKEVYETRSDRLDWIRKRLMEMYDNA